MILRSETCIDKYSLIKCIIEYPFGTLKNIRDEISIVFLHIILKIVIKILVGKGILDSLYTVILY